MMDRWLPNSPIEYRMEVKESMPVWVQRGFDDCFFDEDEKYLWTVAPVNSKELRTELLARGFVIRTPVRRLTHPPR